MVSIFSCRICVARRFSRDTCTMPKPCVMPRYSVTNWTPMIAAATNTSISVKAFDPASALR